MKTLNPSAPFRSPPSSIAGALPLLSNARHHPPRPPDQASASLDFDQDTVLATLASYSDDWPRAVDFFRWVSSRFIHTPATHSLLISILGKHFEFTLAWSHIISINPSPDRSVLRSHFNRLAAAHLVQDALDAFRRSADFGLYDAATFSLLIDALCDHRHVIEAADLCKNPPFPIDTKIYNMLLRGWLRMGWWGRCREFWEEMDQKGVAKDLHSYSIYMDILSKSGKPWKAIKVYKEMRSRNIALDVVAYNTVIQAVGKSDGVDRAITLYKEMIERGCEPNVVTFNTIIKLLCGDGRINEGYAFFEQMRKKGCDPNVITYHCFFRNLNRPKEILWLFDRMVNTGCRPRMDTYVMLMNKFGRWGFLRPVLLVWKAMEEHGCSPDAFAYNALIDALLQKGMVDIARKYDEEMLAKGLSPKPRKELGTGGFSARSSADIVSDDHNALSNVF
ncbi:pentatricopeptide repeat-containing protein At1g80550, mitochondrial-like [Dioscorea cayenensis subsp. rotundata]|uniref:Pentatricopeptide repeat-containing protein At1g80550, mitochondrial-like n=1 Tax=Dioscorea cayennensis subsp. rotundata TaxID=55577 RepID=A0AB40AUF9_DIOCR|nr:pentatricopeptide repeat-containing protein At1g80550, mitochondrial-like [Dioscorea cayenensis subsp. rotundata]XP_039118610.1 pentatricopeptide repeat-containing protein At1g80550, mitochondrial-like [Dioscorea cayenensis subsp. rotundata]